MPFNSPLLRNVDHIVTNLIEAGLYDVYKRWTLDFVRAMFVELQSEDSGRSALTWSELDGIFMLLLGGLFLSTVLLLGEFVHKHIVLCRTRRRKLATRLLAAEVRLMMDNAYAKNIPKQQPQEIVFQLGDI